MMRKIIKVLAVCGMILLLAWGGLCVYANVVVFNNSPTNAYPDVSKAMYAVHIVNTGNMVFTNSYDYRDQKYVLHGFWESYKEGFVYRKGDITLDERIFGKINVKPR